MVGALGANTQRDMNMAAKKRARGKADPVRAFQAKQNAVVAAAIDHAAWEWSRSGRASADAEDARALQKIASLVRRNRLEAAHEAAAHLDTVVRDQLPLAFIGLLYVNGIHW